jgi:hypothetical protein
MHDAELRCSRTVTQLNVEGDNIGVLKAVARVGRLFSAPGSLRGMFQKCAGGGDMASQEYDVASGGEAIQRRPLHQQDTTIAYRRTHSSHHSAIQTTNEDIDQAMWPRIYEHVDARKVPKRDYEDTLF